MIIKFYNANPFGEAYTNAEIYNTALHEIGMLLAYPVIATIPPM